jgi:hypothetical protein
MKLLRTTLNSLFAQTCFIGYCSWLLLLSIGSGCTQQEPTSGVPQKPASKAQPAALVRPPALPARQEVRVNDTLVLECTRPYTTLVPDAGRPPMTMWLHMALRGRRGYYEVLSSPDTLSLYCLFQCTDEALVSARGDVLHFSVLEPGRLLGDEARRGQPLPDNAVYALDRWVWDVRYRHHTDYLTADLKEWNWRDAPCFTGGFIGKEEYRVLPHWISQEQSYLKRRHHLPPAHRLLAYCTFSRELAAMDASAYRQSYGPLLLRLLRAWRAYPLPAATARHFDRSIRDLWVALQKAPFPARQAVARP